MNNKTTLTNFKIIQRQDKNNQDYYIIFDNNNENGNNAYFCWQGTVKTGWDSLPKLQDLEEIEIEWQPQEKGNRVINIYTVDTEFFA